MIDVTHLPMIDSHCHLTAPQFDPDREAVIARATAAGIDRMICIADEIADIAACRAVAEEHAGIYFTAGSHPHHGDAFVASRDLPVIRQEAAHEKCVAIGEIGLDYHYMDSPKDTQQRVFEAQLALAKELNLPAVVHCREAVEDVWTIVNHVKPQNLVLHCCSERWEDVEKFVRAGYFLSFTGNVTYPNADVIRNTAKHCPMEQLMIETDAPFLAPVPHRGKRCEPALVALVSNSIAAIKELSPAEMDRLTSANTIRFFGLHNS